VESELQIKTERLSEMLSAENLGGVLLNTQHNFAWLTGGRSNGINLSSENGACFIFVRRDGKKYVLANNIEMPRLLREEISADDFEPVEFAWEDEKASGDFVFEKAKSLLDQTGEIACDLLSNPNFRSIENLISRRRYSLTAQEIERYKSLGQDSNKALREVFDSINPGETEIEIARKTKDSLSKYGINSVVTLVGADLRIENYRHPVPTENIWEKILLIAVCAKRDGLIANLSRIACSGKIPDELRKKTDATTQVLVNLLKNTKAGTSGAELYETAKSAYAASDYADEINKHHQGGACGYKTRDWVAHPKSGEIVQNNQAFAWNPTITGSKVEETFIVNNNVLENLTTTSDFPSITVQVNDQNIALSDILVV
jgi:Xaa-Pro dipeptidase